MLLQGHTAIVTGAGRNIGRSIALRLAQEGADIGVAVKSSMSEAQGVVNTIRGMGRKAEAFTVDVGKRDECHRLVAAVHERLGAPSILVNNAGIRFRAPIEELDEDRVRRVIDTNMMGPLWMTQAVIPNMKQAGYGRIVNITGVALHYMMSGVAPVVASKGGVMVLTRTAAFETAPYGITVNAVAPGITNTARKPGQGEITPEYQAQRLAKIPRGMLMEPDEIAGAVLFLVRPDSGAITGQTLHVNGGMAMVS